MLAIVLTVLTGIATAFKAIVSILSTTIGQLVVALLFAFCLGLVVDHEFEGRALSLIEAKQQTEVLQAKAAQQAVDRLAIQEAQTEIAAQRKLTAKYRTLLGKVSSHVSPTAPCITWGLVRVLDAAISGSDPATLDLPAGATDAACSTVTAVALATSVAANYGRAHQNAEQLTRLQAYVKGLANASR